MNGNYEKRGTVQRGGTSGSGGQTTDRNVRSLMQKYNRKNAPLIKTKGQTLGNVRLVPRLFVECGEVFLEASVGSEKLYIVRNMEEFCLHMRHGDRVEYGKLLTLTHKPELFDEESRPLVEFIMSQFGEIQTYRGSYGSTYGRDSAFSHGKRGMRLSLTAVDTFLRLWMDRQLEVSFGNPYRGNEDWRCTVKAMNLRIPVHVRRDDAGGFSLEMPKYRYLNGEKHLYLLTGEFRGDAFLWQCEEGFTEQMRDLVEAADHSGGYFYVAAADMVDFCSNVICEIQDNVELSGDVESLLNYVPDDMEAMVYLDCPKNDTITARAICRYGDRYIDPYRNEEVSETGEQLATRSEGTAEKRRSAVRDSRKEYALKLMLSGYFDAYDRELSVLYFQGNNDRIFDFVRNGAGELAGYAEVLATDRYRRIAAAVPPKLAVGVSLVSGLLKVNFDLEEFPVDELMDALQQYKVRRRYHRLRNGSFMRLEDDEFSGILRLVEGLRLTREDLENGEVELPQYRAMLLNDLLKGSEQITYERDLPFKKLVREMKSVEDSDYKVPEVLAGVLRDYQKTGFRWMATLSDYGFGGILADDMGLGKTLEVIAFLLAEKDRLRESERLEVMETNQGECRELLALVVCPASLVLNWEEEVRKFAPQLSTLSVIGTAGDRRRMIAEAGLRKGESCDLMITSYDLLKRDIDCYENMVFRYHIVDEAQYIKNYSTQNARAVKRIRSGRRFALTGTPVENRLSELWSIFDFLMPGYLYGYEDFKNEYENAIIKDHDDAAVRMLEKQIAPFVLRRLKRNVLQELPEKVESVVYASMGTEQRKLYLANLAKAKLEIGKGFTDKGFETNKMVVLALLTRLRQICCHPGLCYEDYAKDSGKLETCLELVREAVAGGHKILLFSQFTTMLDLLKPRLEKDGISTFLLTGKTSKEERRALVERFNSPEETTPVFLISLKAGGTGLNLTAADVVIHYDPWWNLAAQNQATDRAHRIGQKNSVQVYKLIAKDSIEEKILKLQESKRDLADAVIRENETMLTAMSGEELLELL